MPTLFFDVSDLIGYFTLNRQPTGIQRVQIEIVSSVLAGGRADVALCRFLADAGRWATVPPGPFLLLTAMSKTDGEATAPDWLAATRAFDGQCATAPSPDFRHGDVLVNLGTSWWLPDYFLQVRALKAVHAIRYVPLIYDFIPALLPRFCDPGLVREFVGWVAGVFAHADFFLAISEATRRDLIGMAERLGGPPTAERVGVVPLDADFRPAAASGARRRFDRPHVLFVSTIEARKNQLGALDAWQALIDRHGAERVPQLVLVGKLGFGGPAVLDRIAAAPALARRVTVLKGVDDGALAALYRDALFTLYPSFYEGWGLPVTESLCHGRVPLIADNSSLPEAGGPFALYHATGSTEALVAQAEKLIFDDRHRHAAEARIRADFRARSWAEIAGQMLGHLDAWIGRAEPTGWRPPTVLTGRYYRFVRNRSARVWRGMGSAETLRQGGWLALEDWGCWSRPTGGELAFTGPDAPTTLMLELRGPVEAPVEAGVTLDGRTMGRVRLDADARRWVDIALPGGGGPLRLRLDTLPLSRQAINTGVGLAGLMLLDPADGKAHDDFVEAVALGYLPDHAAYRPEMIKWKL